MNKRFLTLSSLLATSLSLTACLARDRGGDTDTAELAADSTLAANDEAALLSSMLDGTSGVAPLSADGAAAAIAAHLEARYNPSGCVDVTQEGLTITAVFSGCTGPRGLRLLDGTAVLDVSAGAGGAIVVDANATDFHVGQATLDIAATATYTGAGDTQSLAVVTRSGGVGALGYTLEHDGDYTVTWDSDCLTIDGAWSSSRGDLSRSTTANVTRCVAECPIGTVTRDTVRDRHIEITFDGTTTARWTSSAGGSGQFQLACGL